MKRRKGFSIIEILTVIAIIAILAALVFLGMKLFGNQGRERSTKVTMQNLKSMVAELKAGGGGNALPILPDTITAPNGSTHEDGGTVRFDPLIVNGTLGAMNILRTFPNNKAAMDQLPPAQLLKQNGNQTHIMLDAWGFPILYVPHKLNGVTVAGAGQVIVAPDNKPFFASPGPDGNFATGDDNVYSFND